MFQSNVTNNDQLAVLSANQWYGSSNSFTMNYSTSIEFQSYEIGESDIIIFNDIASQSHQR